MKPTVHEPPLGSNVTEFIAAESGAGQEMFANLLFSSLNCHLGEKLSLQKRP